MYLSLIYGNDIDVVQVMWTVCYYIRRNSFLNKLDYSITVLL